jgi:hypothetical protein
MAQGREAVIGGVAAGISTPSRQVPPLKRPSGKFPVKASFGQVPVKAPPA